MLQFNTYQMLKDQILNIIKIERQKGKDDNQIKVYLLGLGFNLTDIEQFIKNKTNPNLTQKNEAFGRDTKKHHYLSFVIITIIIIAGISFFLFTDTILMLISVIL